MNNVNFYCILCICLFRKDLLIIFIVLGVVLGVGDFVEIKKLDFFFMGFIV